LELHFKEQDELQQRINPRPRCPLRAASAALQPLFAVVYVRTAEAGSPFELNTKQIRLPALGHPPLEFC
jgi:hypothetical protein